MKITIINVDLIRVSSNTEEFLIYLRYLFFYINLMSYEAGSKECRHLIEAKESLLSALDALSSINSTDLIQIQIKEIYNKLEQMHDNRKKIESATNYR